MTGLKIVLDSREVKDCIACGEGMPYNECPHPKRKCGHHCNHSWTHDECCWCGAEFGEEGKEVKQDDR